MANMATIKSAMATSSPIVNIRSLMTDGQKRFEAILGQKAQGFISSVINLVNNDKYLKAADPQSVFMSAVVAATLDLPVDKNLGFASIIAYGNKAQFQVGYKGFVQLAIRTGLYRTINATEVYEGELQSVNRLTGEILFDQTKRVSDKVVGYAAYFRLMNGFEKTKYMTAEEIESHAKRYSKNYRSSKGETVWQTHFHQMALKTVLKYLLSHYGILSVEMHRAVASDQGVVLDPGTNSTPPMVDYPDNNVIDAETDDIDAATPPLETEHVAEMHKPGQDGE